MILDVSGVKKGRAERVLIQGIDEDSMLKWSDGTFSVLFSVADAKEPQASLEMVIKENFSGEARKVPGRPGAPPVVVSRIFATELHLF